MTEYTPRPERAYYNEIDSYAVQWLRNLIAAGHIAPGDVDDRSIVDVRPADLRGYTQCHFFAGIGGWSRALRLAGWPDDRPVWTGSCPCQPFSIAGTKYGTDDARHLWPEFARLIAERSPPVVFGEQVASKDGRGWLAGVRVDLEELGYAVGAADLCAAGAEAPHIRQRLYWVGHADGAGRASCDLLSVGTEARPGQPKKSGLPRGLGDTDCAGSEGWGRAERGEQREIRQIESRSTSCQPSIEQSDSWSRYDLVQCTDGKARRFEPGSFPLAHGVSNRVGRLRAYGNAIVPQVAAAFIGASRDVIG
jgi:DNA (cytosine-5)-methyltransferase 1